ncbi:hypothetical protein Ahy_B09g098161 [Arachis hypogaea]|uniref:Protein FAR1-RELATED SEQUENCE n=1 Tax=Arachis hypogaea TaxID=3818 RepID=A0A444XRA7_ARAHY|nr:hypothetical protein Ahy_B09g098161 [Arachis hypogaea]
MLGDYEIVEFEEWWASMVNSFGVNDMEYVATTHMRGKFFARLRTTSRCEALHSQVIRFVKSCYSIKEFLHHFCQWMHLLRNNEAETDYYISYGFSIIQTQVQALERLGATIYTLQEKYRGVLLVSIVIVESINCDNS